MAPPLSRQAKNALKAEVHGNFVFLQRVGIIIIPTISTGHSRTCAN